MGNAMLIKAGGGSSGGSGGLDQIFTYNGVYICNKTGSYLITCVGGGGGGTYGNCARNDGTIDEGNTIGLHGNRGSINSKTIQLTKGTVYKVTVGKAGCAANSYTSGNGVTSGGTSSFGTLVSAIGGAHRVMTVPDGINTHTASSDVFNAVANNCDSGTIGYGISGNFNIHYAGNAISWLYTNDGYNVSTSGSIKIEYGYGGAGSGMGEWVNVNNAKRTGDYYNLSNTTDGGPGIVTVKYIG